MGQNTHYELIAAWRAGEPVGAELRRALSPLVEELHANYWGPAFLTLADLVDELRDSDIPAADVLDWVRERIAYAPREQKRWERNLLDIPESTARTRRNAGQHVPGLCEAKPCLPDAGSSRRKTPGLRPAQKYSGSPDPEQERNELLSFAKTDYEKLVGRCFLFGDTNEEAAVKLNTTETMIKRIETILRKRAGYE